MGNRASVSQKPSVLSLPVECLIQARRLVSLPHDASLADALSLFRKKNISCVPIISSKTEFALLDIMDIASFVAFSYKQLGQVEFLKKRDEVFKLRCVELANFSARNQAYTIKKDLTISQLIHEMRLTGSHRVVLVNEANEIVYIVTMSMIVEFILLNLDVLHESPDEPLSAINFIGQFPAIQLPANDPTHSTVLDAIILMYNKNISSIPIVGSLSGSSSKQVIFSVRDFKYIDKENFEDLMLPPIKFIEKYQNYSKSTAFQDTSLTLRDLLRKMVNESIHNMYFKFSSNRDVNDPIPTTPTNKRVNQYNSSMMEAQLPTPTPLLQSQILAYQSIGDNSKKLESSDVDGKEKVSMNGVNGGDTMFSVITNIDVVDFLLEDFLIDVSDQDEE
ncbi:hypothetical protein HK098_001001 [Nowakowskiella sp. JEL0407]|nr:hypothetical protein HK098_001001 [Nowakowskiella sp. JEL0407]